MLAFTDRRDRVEVVFTDRHGVTGGGPAGASTDMFAELDLAEPRLDGSEDVEVDLESGLERLDENLDILGYAVARGGPPAADDLFALPADAAVPVMVRVRQVHGNHVHVVDEAWLASSRLRPTDVPPGSSIALRAAQALVEADGLVTDLPGIALLVRVADCLPVLLADPARGVVGAAHAGRNGLVLGVVPATVARMRDLGAEELVAWVGPHICGRCYEVPEDMRAEVAAAVPEAHAETSWGTPAVDVGAGVRAQLAAAGVEVVDAARCTREEQDLWSHRRDGAAAGRLGGLVWVRP